MVTRVLAMDHEAAVAGRDCGEVDLRRKGAGVAEHDIAVARLGAGVAGRRRLCSDDEIVEAVAVNVAGQGHRPAGEIVRILAMDDEAAVAARDRSKVDLRRKAAGVAEHHVAVARLDACIVRAIAKSAPMMRSSKPSPLMSPAEETEVPD